MSKKIYDLIVIGGGSGGLGCARRASGLYKKNVLLIEAAPLGGTCVNVGCVPKKVTWAAANLKESLSDAAGYCFAPVAAPLDYAAFKAKRDAYVARLNGIYVKNLANDAVTRVEGWAEFVNAHTVKVGGTEYTGEHVLIATGGRPAVPKNVPGAELGITSDGFFELTEVPRRVAVIGAGYIGVELAGILNALGAETSLMFRHGTFLRPFDHEIIHLLDEEMVKDGVSMVRHSSTRKLERNDDGSITVTYAQKDVVSTLTVDCVLWAVGRDPNTDNNGLDKTGVKTNARGHIEVDAMQNTNVEKVYALGDVCGRAELTPVAIAAGRKLAERLFGGNPLARLDYTNIPTAIFSHPPIGTCGLSEEDAVKKYGREGLKIYRSKFTNMYHAMTDRKTPTMMKLITVLPEERIVGAHMLGIASDETAQWLGLITKLGLTKAQLDSVVAVHPSAAEEWVTMR